MLFPVAGRQQLPIFRSLGALIKPSTGRQRKGETAKAALLFSQRATLTGL